MGWEWGWRGSARYLAAIAWGWLWRGDFGRVRDAHGLVMAPEPAAVSAGAGEPCGCGAGRSEVGWRGGGLGVVRVASDLFGRGRESKVLPVHRRVFPFGVAITKC